ncbi:MAG TPA: pirin family protein [Desulfomonilia bacterium]|nr:pirin family protein [Desulfomonilia bacterium]
MGTIRKIEKVLKGKPTIEGAGVHLKRVFGNQHVPQLDPFLLLDDFHSDNPEDYIKGFPWHPHRGIETITYVLNGKVEHGDSMGNKGVISPGDIQWMTAGSGIIHQEMPKGQRDGQMWGFQLWANLPAARKMMDPRYRDVKRSQVPEVILDNNVKVRIICGEINGTKGPVQDIVIDPEYLDVTVPAGTGFTHRVKEGHRSFAYVIEGKGYFEPERDPYGFEVESRNYFDFQRDCLMGPETLVLYQDGEELIISTEKEDVRYLLISGKPIGEPVAWYGPIVMNTQDELRTAFDEYQRGTFIKHDRPH